MNTKQFVNRHGITATVDYADSNPNNPDWTDANHFKVTLYNNLGKQLTTPFSQGYGISGKPEAADVLDSLASDAASIEQDESFEDWASNLGYDTDSRKALRIYRACEREAKKLRQFLGPKSYAQLLWDTERL